ncbi:MAG TPA: Uma2 family endonuclease [Pyrinomonadaceae bacterium]|jgi:Uma2 family endonuclease
MSVQSSDAARSVRIAKYYFTVAQYERMAEVGVLSPDCRVELIEGEIVKMSPIGKRHAACVNRLNRLLGQALGTAAIVSVQNPIRLDDYSEPQPDVALLKPRADFYEQALPAPADVLLVIEVCDTTLEYDRQIKLPLYARAGLPEVWLVNLADEQIETYAHPAADAYQTNARHQRGADVQAHTIAGLHPAAADIF